MQLTNEILEKPSPIMVTRVSPVVGPMVGCADFNHIEGAYAKITELLMWLLPIVATESVTFDGIDGGDVHAINEDVKNSASVPVMPPANPKKHWILVLFGKCVPHTATCVPPMSRPEEGNTPRT